MKLYNVTLRSLLVWLIAICIGMGLAIASSPALSQLTNKVTIEAPNVVSINWSSNSGQLAIGYSNGLVSVWSVSDLTNLEVTNSASYVKPQVSVTSLDFAPSGSVLAIGFSNGEISIWDLEDNTQQSLDDPKDPVRLLQWSPDGTKLASALDDHILLWDAVSGETLASLPEHAIQVSWSPTSEHLVSRTLTGLTNVWELETGQLVSSIHRGAPADLSPDGLLIGVGTANEIELRDVMNGQLVSRYSDGHQAGVSAIAWSSDGHRLASGSGILGDDYTVRIWNADNGNEEIVLTGHEDNVISLLWYPDDSHLVSASFDDTVRVWDTIAGQPVGTFRMQINDVSKIAVSPNGELVATIDGDGSVNIWDISVQPQ